MRALTPRPPLTNCNAQGSEGSRERQLDALHAELTVAREECDAARREAAALQAANAELQVCASAAAAWWPLVWEVADL